MHIVRILVPAVTVLCFLSGAEPSLADKFKNPTAVFSGLDKITGRIIAFEVAVNETVQFGALQLTPKICFSRPVTEKPQTTSFVEVDEITTSSDYKRLFSGWMFASSPGLSAIEHPVYDIWLTGCKGATEKDLVKTKPEEEEVIAAPSNENQLAKPLGPDGKPLLEPAERGGTHPAWPAPEYGPCAGAAANPAVFPAPRQWRRRHRRCQSGYSGRPAQQLRPLSARFPLLARRSSRSSMFPVLALR
jgi:hypothetical protein